MQTKGFPNDPGRDVRMLASPKRSTCLAIAEGCRHDRSELTHERLGRFDSAKPALDDDGAIT